MTPFPYPSHDARPPVDVCPHCLRAVNGHQFLTPDDQIITSYHCQEHGDVIPRRSHVRNP